ncbi:MAG TPA: hypothetical protein VFR18_08520 [Terriglobia bacterium]|nr:hypothetical protein [Terriglobia bacterium]
MTDLLTNRDLVCSLTVSIESLSIAGVHIGTASRYVPRERIVDVTNSPIVRTYRKTREAGPQFFDGTGRQIPLSEVIDSVIYSNGILHLPEGASFKIKDGLVVGLALYSASLSRRFEDLESYEDFVRAFGAPDRVTEMEDDGELMAYDHYYFRLHKHATWGVMPSGKVESVNWGDFPGNAG